MNSICGVYYEYIHLSQNDNLKNSYSSIESVCLKVQINTLT